MNSIKQIFSKIKLKPSAESEVNRKPEINRDVFVDFRPSDVENPRNWSPARKWYITVIVVFISINGNLASTITTGTTQSITEEFGISRVAAQLTTTLFLLGSCAGPLLFAPLSEFCGRQCILYITFLAYLGFTFLTAWPRSFGGLLVGRFLAGSFVAGPAVTAPGVISDLWDIVDRGNAMAIFSCAAWIGPAAGSVISGFLQLKLNWRWGMYVCLWLGAFSILPLLMVPETHGSTVLAHKAKRARHQGYRHDGHNIQSESEASRPKLLQIYKISLTRPWVLLFDPISFFCCLYSAVIFTLQFMLFTIYPIVFQDMRGWNPGVSQIPILGQAVGGVMGVFIIFADTKRRRQKANSGKALLPEDRMILAMIGGVGFPIFMFWLSWSAQYNSVHWIVPTIGGTLLATCLMLIFFANLNYIVDAYADYAASVNAANTIARCSSSAAAPLFTRQMFSALGIGGGGSLIAGVAALLAITPFLFHRYGHVIRSKSKYALA